MTLVAGCYERFLFGHAVQEDGKLPRRFTYAAHQGSVRAVSAAGRFVASGGADDQIHLYDVHEGLDLGYLINPGRGAVSSLAFHVPPGRAQPSHLLSGSADGTIGVWQQEGGWECARTLGAPGTSKGDGVEAAAARQSASGQPSHEVSSLAIHPSGRVAVAASRDGFLKTWDLVKGKSAGHATRLGGGSASTGGSAAAALRVNPNGAAGADAGASAAFDPSGTRYAVLSAGTLEISDIAAGGDRRSEEAGEKGEKGAKVVAVRAPGGGLLLCFAWLDPRRLAAGDSDGGLHVWDAVDGSLLAEVKAAHARRVRAVAAEPVVRGLEPAEAAGGGPAGASTPARRLASASTDGVLRVWRLEKAGSAEGSSPPFSLVKVAETDTRARLTCLAWAPAKEAVAAAQRGVTKLRKARKEARKEARKAGGGGARGEAREIAGERKRGAAAAAAVAAPTGSHGKVAAGAGRGVGRAGRGAGEADAASRRGEREARSAARSAPAREEGASTSPDAPAEGVLRGDGTVDFTAGEDAKKVAQRARKSKLDAERVAARRKRFREKVAVGPAGMGSGAPRKRRG